MTYNFFTLAFTGKWKHLEPDFQTFHFRDSLIRIRLTILIAILLYASFAILDAILAPELKDTFWVLRFAVVGPVAVGVLVYSFNPGFEKYSQLCLFIMCLTGGIAIELMIVMAGPPVSYYYYAGIILIFITIYNLLRMRFVWAVGCSWLIVICYEIVAFWLSDNPGHVLISNNFFFISANVLCMLAGYSTELNLRKIFFSNLNLEKARNDIALINAELDKRVKERTNELLEKTEKLQTEIHERKISEEQKKELENRLIQSHKMESIGTLAGGIAHDFNNILSSIIGYAELALTEVGTDTGVEKNLQEIFTGGKRAKELVKQILAFARQSDEEIKPVQISLVAKEVIRFVRSSLPSTIEITSELKSTSLVMGNVTQLHQVLMNLCTNASHAMEPGGGVLQLSLKDVILDKTSADYTDELKEGTYVQIKISDSGTGIDKKIMDSIFNPYFTTKKIGEGTGMGLAMVHGIVESYQGKITVDSAPGQGSTFTIYLPVTSQRLAEEPYEPEILPRGSEHILLIDDEEPIVEVLSQLLSQLGYTVTSSLSSDDALTLFRSSPDAYDIVITDMTMPKMTGDILAAELINIRRNIPVILCTGHSKKMTDEEAKKIGIRAFALKPIMQADLSRLIRDVLDK